MLGLNDLTQEQIIKENIDKIAEIQQQANNSIGIAIVKSEEKSSENSLQNKPNMLNRLEEMQQPESMPELQFSNHEIDSKKIHETKKNQHLSNSMDFKNP